MKKFLFALLLAAGAASCATKENYEDQVGNPNLEITKEPTPGDASGINPKMFELLNLDYPGLESVKIFYEAGDLFAAAYELKKYYIERQIINPGVNILGATSFTSAQKSIADQATSEGGYRFKVASYTDSEGMYYSFKNDEGGIDWSFVPDELAGDNEFKYQIHRHQWMLTQAQVYHVTKDEKYVQAWVEAYFDWLKTFPCPEGQTQDKIWCGLQPCSRVQYQLDILPYYVRSETMTPAVLSDFLVAFHLHMVNILANPYYEEGSNIRISQDLVVLLAGILMPEFKDSPMWYETGKNAVCYQAVNQFHADGVQNELDFGYHIGVVDDFYTAYKTAYLNGRFSDFPSDYLDCLRKAVGFVKDYMYPNYSVEVINDTHASSYTKNILIKNFKKFAEIFPEDQDIKWIATDGEYGVMPVTTFAQYPESGYYMMRNGWTSSATMLIHKNPTSAAKWAHNHSDNGHISLYVNGRRFLPDAGSYQYSQASGADNSGYLAVRRSDAHNTLTKDGTDKIEARAGKLLKTETDASYELVVTENPAYSDLTHRRAIYFVDKKFFVVVDEAYGGFVGKVNLNFNLWGGPGDAPGNPVSGVDYVEVDDAYSGNARGVHSTFDDGNNILLKTFSETSDNQDFVVSETFYSNATLEKTPRKSYVYSLTKADGKAARFITVILPYGSSSDFSNQQVNAIFTDNPNPENAGTFHGNEGAAVKVSVNGKDYSLSYNLN